MNDNTTTTRKVRSTLTLDAATKKAWITSWNTTQKLPSRDIPCSSCAQGITATHGNLASKVKAYGGIQALLDGFVCKSCKAAAQGPKTPRAPKTPRKARKTEEDPTAITKDAQGRYNIPNVNLNPTRVAYSIEDMAASPELTQEFTNQVCLQPQLFLNSSSTCDHCVLYTNCAARCKTLSRAKQRQLARA